jgi:hypothetical protein
MSNKPHMKPAPIRGDFGLGLCLSCVGEVIAGAVIQPRFAVSLAPMGWPPGGQQIMFVAVPACFEHIQAQAEAVKAGPRTPLLVAAGRL